MERLAKMLQKVVSVPKATVDEREQDEKKAAQQ
jgi:hypothetical protein